jgi:prolycopene isomerase
VKTKKDYLAVVIGTGLGGLRAANYLAREGIFVYVVEQHSIPGGYATSLDRAWGAVYFSVPWGGF